jgi:hypothetical protein
VKWCGRLAAVLIAGWVSRNESVLTAGPPPVPPEQIQVFFEPDIIPKHSRVAILNASGSQGFTNQGQMID